MGQNEILQLNNELSDYLKKNINQKSFIYAPCVPEKYWANDNIKVAICNLEAYCKNEEEYKNFESIQTITKEMLEQWSYGNQTIAKTFLINYFVKEILSGKLIKSDSEKLREIRKRIITDEKFGDNMYHKMNESLYFNFRYSISDKTNADYSYILNAYKNNDFYIDFYRRYIKAAEINILLISGKLGTELLRIIYPKIQESFDFKGPPVTYDNSIFVSIPHPSRISYRCISERLKTISDFVRKELDKKG